MCNRGVATPGPTLSFTCRVLVLARWPIGNILDIRCLCVLAKISKRGLSLATENSNYWFHFSFAASRLTLSFLLLFLSPFFAFFQLFFLLLCQLSFSFLSTSLSSLFCFYLPSLLPCFSFLYPLSLSPLLASLLPPLLFWFILPLSLSTLSPYSLFFSYSFFFSSLSLYYTFLSSLQNWMKTLIQYFCSLCPVKVTLSLSINYQGRVSSTLQ